MAKQTVTTLIDDIDGSQADQTIAFSYRGVNYSIDLSDRNAGIFDKAVDKFVRHARRETGRRTAAKAAASAGRRPDLSDIRAWAAENGWEVSTRGRIAAEVLEAYDAVH